MTSADAFDAEPRALKYAVFHDGLCRVLTARRFEAAIVSEHRREEPLICPNEKNEYVPHTFQTTFIRYSLLFYAIPEPRHRRYYE